MFQIINMEKWYEFMNDKDCASIIGSYSKPYISTAYAFIQGYRHANDEIEQWIEDLEKRFPIGDEK